jgi:hypothetical protein
MRNTFLFLGAGALALAGCAGEPVELPADINEAAKTCFLVQALNLRDESSRYTEDTMTLTEYAKSVQYSMIAASQDANFKIGTVLQTLPEVEKMAPQIEAQDYRSALPECQERFGISGKNAAPTLPAKDLDAGLSCFAMSQFFLGGVQGEDVDTEGKEEFYSELNSRIERTLDALITQDAKALAAFSNQNDAEAMITTGLKQAFSQGDPQSYLAACDKRFPAK